MGTEWGAGIEKGAGSPKRRLLFRWEVTVSWTGERECCVDPHRTLSTLGSEL